MRDHRTGWVTRTTTYFCDSISFVVSLVVITTLFIAVSYIRGGISQISFGNKDLYTILDIFCESIAMLLGIALLALLLFGTFSTIISAHKNREKEKSPIDVNVEANNLPLFSEIPSLTTQNNENCPRAFYPVVAETPLRGKAASFHYNLAHNEFESSLSHDDLFHLVDEIESSENIAIPQYL